tara:strand:+ start:6134 stop:7171 length:1038 start_codon:yes stop_codon:yes gene_type:complete
MIYIIGAGHAGCYAAYLLAKQNHTVEILEKNKIIGSPAQCTGIVTRDIDSLLKIPNKLIHTTINHARIHAPNKEFVKVKLKNGNYILKRTQFVQHIADLAEKQGVKIKQQKFTPSTKLNSQYIIGADSPNSTIGKTYGFKTQRKFFEAPQILAEFPNDNIIDLYTNLGTFAWVTPVTKNTALIGLLAYKDSLKLMQSFMTRLNITKSQILERNGGYVPIFDPYLKTQKNNIFLLGDAATQVKATTAGGIIQSMIAAKALTHSIIHKKNYDVEWRKKLFFDLYLHLKTHKILQKLKAHDWNKLIALFQQPKLKSILENNNREKISKFLFQLPLTEPKLLTYLKFIL